MNAFHLQSVWIVQLHSSLRELVSGLGRALRAGNVPVFVCARQVRSPFVRALRRDLTSTLSSYPRPLPSMLLCRCVHVRLLMRRLCPASQLHTRRRGFRGSLLQLRIGSRPRHDLCCYSIWYLVAVLHLVTYATPLRTGCARRNAAIASCRRGLKGAPLLLACFFAACFAPQAYAINAGAAHDLLPSSSASPIVPGSCTGGIRSPTWFGPTEDPPDHDRLFEVLVLRLQKSATITTQWWDPGLGSGYVCCTASHDLSFGPPTCRYFPALPQPAGGAVVLGEAPFDVLSSLQVPIFIQVAGSWEPCFVVHFCGAVTHQDIKDAVGELWPANGQVYVGFCTQPLSVGHSFSPTVGLLVRVLQPGVVPRPLRSLDARLADPTDLHIFPSDMPPRAAPRATHVAVLGTDSLTLIIDAASCYTVGDLKSQAGKHLSLGPGDVSMFAPCRPICDLYVRGIEAASVLGILPCSLQNACGVFVDPRAIGHPVALVVLPPIPYTLTGVLHLLQIPRPRHLRFALYGAPRTGGHCEGFIPKQAALIVLAPDPADAITPHDLAEGLGHPDPTSVGDDISPLGLHGPPHGDVTPSPHITVPDTSFARGHCAAACTAIAIPAFEGSVASASSAADGCQAGTRPSATCCTTACPDAPSPAQVVAMHVIQEPPHTFPDLRSAPATALVSSPEADLCNVPAAGNDSDTWNCGSRQHALPMRHHGDTSAEPLVHHPAAPVTEAPSPCPGF